MRLLVIPLLLVPLAAAAEPPRPRITGLAHVALYVADLAKARAYYEDFLGYAEPYHFRNADGSPALAFVKVNDRQYLELFPEREAGGDRLNHVAFETDDAEALRVYLRSRGVAVPDRATKGRIGNTSFGVKDPDGHSVEFVQYQPGSWTLREKGRAIGPGAISSSLRHAGILAGELGASLRFYREVLGFREIWRGSRDGQVLSWVNLQVPDGDDYLELMLYRDLPAPSERGSQHHICLEVADVGQAADAVKARAARASYARPLEVRTGINRKRQLNLFDPDGTRTELMEPGTVDGAPAPSSTAPPPVPKAPAASPEQIGPGLNLYRAPMNGRNFECYGEDPWLAGRIAAAFVRGVQPQGVSATVEHYLGNNSELDRHRTDSAIDERTLRAGRQGRRRLGALELLRRHRCHRRRRDLGEGRQAHAPLRPRLREASRL